MHKPNDIHIYALTPPINYPKWKLSSFLTRLPITTNCSKTVPCKVILIHFSLIQEYQNKIERLQLYKNKIL